MDEKLLAIAERFCYDFEKFFALDENRELPISDSYLSAMEKWFNESRVCIELLTGISPKEIVKEEIENKTIYTVYTLSYSAALKFANVLKRPAPEYIIDLKSKLKFTT